MRVLLVNTNREHLPDPVPPVGLAYVGGALVREGHEVRVCDLCFATDPSAELREAVRCFAPEAIGVTLRNLDDTAFPNPTSYLPFAAEVARTLKETSSAPIVMGGAGFSILPEACLTRLGLELGVVGEGEQVFPALLAALSSGRDPATIPGVMVRRDGKAQYQPAARPKRVTVPAMQGWRLLDVPRYWSQAGQLPIQTQRGCAFECSYCTYPLLEGHAVRARDPGEVADEIACWQTDYGVNQFFFVDSVFNSPLEHATAVLEEILRRELRIGWTAYVTPRHSTREFAQLMARSGCSGVEVGVDGGSETTLSSLRKGFGVEHVRTYFAHAAEAGVKTCVSLVFGAPGENQGTVSETFALFDDLSPQAVVAMLGVRVYPGSPLWAEAVRTRQITPDADPLDPLFYVSEQLSEEDVQAVISCCRARANWIVPGYDIRTDADLFSRLRQRKVRGPLWRLMRPARAAGPVTQA